MEEFIIKYWLEAGFGGVLFILGFGVRKLSQDLKRERDEQKFMNLGVQALLRNELISSYNTHINQGYCPVHDRDNIINMYKQYHNLGANGVVDSLMDELLELPIRCMQDI